MEKLKIIDVFELQKIAQKGIEELACAAALQTPVPADFIKMYLDAFNPYTVKALIDALISACQHATPTAAIEATQRSTNGTPIRPTKTDS